MGDASTNSNFTTVTDDGSTNISNQFSIAYNSGYEPTTVSVYFGYAGTNNPTVMPPNTILNDTTLSFKVTVS